MKTRQRQFRSSALTVLGATLLLSTDMAAGPQLATEIDHLILYGIDTDTFELLRYNFVTDQYVRIGIVVDQNNIVVEDVESLAFIPSGPNKGLYGVTNFYRDFPCKLIKINPLNADAFIYPMPVVDVAVAQKVIGLVTFEDAGGVWQLWGTTESTGPGGEYIIDIDMTVGTESRRVPVGEKFQGLAMDSTGQVFGVKSSGLLFKLNVAPDFSSVTEQGTPTQISGTTKMEALEFAFGDEQPAITAALPGLNPSWWNKGMLFGFDDAADAFMIINPNNGDSYVYDCAFQTIDCEGLVFTTVKTDPVYGAVAAFD